MRRRVSKNLTSLTKCSILSPRVCCARHNNQWERSEKTMMNFTCCPKTEIASFVLFAVVRQNPTTRILQAQFFSFSVTGTKRDSLVAKRPDFLFRFRFLTVWKFLGIEKSYQRSTGRKTTLFSQCCFRFFKNSGKTRKKTQNHICCSPRVLA